MLHFSQKSVLKWIELLGLDRIGLGFYTKKSIKVNRNVGYCFDKIGLDFQFKKSALKWIEMWDAIFNRIGLDFHFKKVDTNFG